MSYNKDTAQFAVATGIPSSSLQWKTVFLSETGNRGVQGAQPARITWLTCVATSSATGCACSATTAALVVMTSAALSAACSRWGATCSCKAPSCQHATAVGSLIKDSVVQAEQERRETFGVNETMRLYHVLHIASSQLSDSTDELSDLHRGEHCCTWRAARGSRWATFLTAATAGSTSWARRLRSTPHSMSRVEAISRCKSQPKLHLCAL